MITFKSRAKYIAARFFNYRNEIDIFTEDNLNTKEFYKILFHRLLGNKIIINDVFPIGCKTEVVNEYNNFIRNSRPQKRKKIFIVDGDLDLIYHGNLPNQKNFFVLDVYCIENYLIDENATIEIIHPKLQESKKNIRSNLNYLGWLNKIKDDLIDIFLHLAVTKKNNIGFEIKSFSKVITNGRDDIIDPTKTKIFIMEICNHINGNINNIIFNKDLKEFRQNWPFSVDTLLAIVSGKDYLLPILGLKISKITHSPRILDKELKMHLAKECDLKRLEKLKNAILAV